MKNIKTIIENIQNLETDFEIFNSRIAEFAKSTNFSNLDSNLLIKYIDSLEDYKKLSSKYKSNVSDDKNNSEEFQAQKEIVIFRLEKLDNLFENNIKKLKLILDSIKIKKESKNKTPDFFESQKEMLDLNQLLYEFYNSYNRNLDFQKQYNIDISLDNKFEKFLESSEKYSNLIKLEIKYLNNLNKYFSDIDVLRVTFWEYLNKIEKNKNIFKYNLNDFFKNYFIENNNYLDVIFKKNLKTKYINKNLDITKSDFYTDIKKFNRKIKKESKEILLFYKFIKFSNNYSDFLKLEDRNNIFKSNKLFTELDNLFKEIIDLKLQNISDFTNFIKNTKNINLKNLDEALDIFKNSYEILKNINIIYDDKIDYLNYGFFDNILAIDNTIWEEFITNFVVNIENSIKKSFIHYRDLKDLFILKWINIETTRFLKKLKIWITKIIWITTDISKITYKWSYWLTKTRKSVNQKLLFLDNPNSSKYKEIKKYLFKKISSIYESKKQAYINRQNRINSSSSSSYSSSSNYKSPSYSSSSYSSSSSSSYSSSSSSYSSSYSSSGSSGW